MVSVTSAGQYFLSIGATGDDRQSIELEAVGEQVGIIVRANPTIQVLVEGDTEANWGAIVTLITVLQQAGVSSPNFITQPLN